MNILGISHSSADPSAAIFVDDTLVGFVEEERLTRTKHASGLFPIGAISCLLSEAALSISDIDYVVHAWDCSKYDRGVIEQHFKAINAEYATTCDDIAYQQKHLAAFTTIGQTAATVGALRRQFGDVRLPEVVFVSHHLAHACGAYFTTDCQDALVVTLDGSGEEVTTAWWLGHDEKLEALGEVKVPHSLGWFYSAFTEYLGFDAYDGEYKIMGLAAYGRENKEWKEKIGRLIWNDGAGGVLSEPVLLSRGPRSHSYYYPDRLVGHMGRPPRSRTDPIEPWHQDVAYAVQRRLEEVVEEMTRYWVRATGRTTLCVGGGVGLNIKLNGTLLRNGAVEELRAFPLCSDAGQSIGGPLALMYQRGEVRKEKLNSLFLGNCYGDEDIERVLIECRLSYNREARIAASVASLISRGHVVGWFQGRMEAGPRALGNRSILADPRRVATRDIVNTIVKARESWRPLCPSMTPGAAARYLRRVVDSPFMTMAFEATDRARTEIPAVVHIDGTVRAQIVDRSTSPLFLELLEEFEARTGVACVLNTSFNVNGEPIVCTPQDAIRTFFATGLDALAIGPFLLTKRAG